MEIAELNGYEKIDELRPEYRLDELLGQGVQGKYRARYAQGTNLVLLAPDVAQSFADEEAVNEALRLVIQLGQLARLPRRHGKVVAARP